MCQHARLVGLAIHTGILAVALVDQILQPVHFIPLVVSPYLNAYKARRENNRYPGILGPISFSAVLLALFEVGC